MTRRKPSGGLEERGRAADPALVRRDLYRLWSPGRGSGQRRDRPQAGALMLPWCRSGMRRGGRWSGAAGAGKRSGPRCPPQVAQMEVAPGRRPEGTKQPQEGPRAGSQQRARVGGREAGKGRREQSTSGRPLRRRARPSPNRPRPPSRGPSSVVGLGPGPTTGRGTGPGGPGRSRGGRFPGKAAARAGGRGPRAGRGGTVSRPQDPSLPAPCRRSSTCLPARCRALSPRRRR